MLLEPLIYCTILYAECVLYSFENGFWTTQMENTDKIEATSYTYIEAQGMFGADQLCLISFKTWCLLNEGGCMVLGIL